MFLFHHSPLSLPQSNFKSLSLRHLKTMQQYICINHLVWWAVGFHPCEYSVFEWWAAGLQKGDEKLNAPLRQQSFVGLDCVWWWHGHHDESDPHTPASQCERGCAQQFVANVRQRIIYRYGRFPFNKNSGLKFRKSHVPNGTVQSGCTDSTQATARWVIILVSRLQKSGKGVTPSRSNSGYAIKPKKQQTTIKHQNAV